MDRAIAVRRTPVLLVIWVDDEWDTNPRVAEWREKGHDVVPMRDVLARWFRRDA